MGQAERGSHALAGGASQSEPQIAAKANDIDKELLERLSFGTRTCLPGHGSASTVAFAVLKKFCADRRDILSPDPERWWSQC